MPSLKREGWGQGRSPAGRGLDAVWNQRESSLDRRDFFQLVDEEEGPDGQRSGTGPGGPDDRWRNEAASHIGDLVASAVTGAWMEWRAMLARAVGLWSRSFRMDGGKWELGRGAGLMHFWE